MKIIPRVIFKKGTIKQETRLFASFLNHPKFPTHRHFIFQAFPELRAMLKEKRGERTAVTIFIKKFYKDHASAIATIKRRSRVSLTTHAPRALRALGNAMGYSWKRNTTYAATPTILPFSPFGTSIFYFSILGAITKKGKLDVVQTAIHEISHFVFFDLLRRIEKRQRFMLPPAALHYLKESLTAALFNEKPLKGALGITDYLGNPEVRELHVRPQGNKAKLFVDYIRDVYTRTKNEKIALNDALQELVITVYQSREAFTRKQALWNRYGRRILSEPPLLKRYRVPIALKKTRGRRESAPSRLHRDLPCAFLPFLCRE